MMIGEGEWYWYCDHCGKELTRGVDAIACEDAGECPYSAEWGGDACGHIVCYHCHRPAKDRWRAL